MANYNVIKTLINQDIKVNGEQAITGAILNNVLQQVVNTLGAGYRFGGFVLPDSPAQTSDNRVFYLGVVPGTYANFGGTVVTAGKFGYFSFDLSWTYRVVDLGAYVKPALGIPAADLAQAVQTSLGKADTALPASDVVDNLTTEDATKALSAKQGKVLGDEVSQLGQEVAELGGGLIDVTNSLVFEQGGISTVNGSDQSSNLQIRSGFIDCKSVSVNVTNGQVYVYAWNGDIYLSARGWKTGTNTITIANATRYKVVFKQNNGTNLSPSQFPEVGATVYKNYLGTVVKTTEQSLSDSEKQTARENIGAADESVREEIALAVNYSKELVGFYTPVFEIGSISIGANGWTYVNNDKRVRLKEGDVIHLQVGDVIGLTDYTDAEFYVGWRKIDGTYGYKATWSSSDFVAGTEGDYVVVIRNKTEVTQQSSDALASLFVNKGTLVVTQKVVGGITGISDSYINYDTNAQTITIPKNILIFDGYSYINPNPNSDVVLDLSSIASSAVLIVYDKIEQLFIAVPYTTQANSSQRIIIAFVRKRQDIYPNSGGISSIFPWSINGNLYGISAEQKRGFVKGINHRGLNTVAPENTIPAFLASVKVGFKYVETDVRFTSDGVPVLLHDSAINRTARNADGTEIATTINIADITYEQALQYDFGIWKGEQFAGTKIPTFEEFMAFCRNKGLSAYIELKVGTQAQIGNLIDIAESYGMKWKCSWISTLNTYLEYVKAKDTSVRLVYVVTSVTQNIIEIATGLKTATNQVAINSNTYTDAEIALCKNAFIPLEVWTISTMGGVLSLDSYISGVTSDSLDASVILFNP